MIEANKALVRRFWKAVGESDAATVKASLSPDLVAIAIGNGLASGTRSYADIVGVVDLFKQIFVDGIHFNVISAIAEGDVVVLQMDGTAKLVNGADYNNHYAVVHHIRDGQIVRMQEYFDTLLAETTLGPLLGGL